VLGSHAGHRGLACATLAAGSAFQGKRRGADSARRLAAAGSIAQEDIMPTPQRVIVIGASAGGVEPLLDVLGPLPADFPAAICVVLHMSPHMESNLPRILRNNGRLDAVHPQTGWPLEPGVIYVGCPDHHLLIEAQGKVAMAKGPKENRFRPSIDALFRSAAYNHGPHVIGVILSGALDDGTAGLWSIKRLGGMAIVQRPSDAYFDAMPMNALEYVDADYTVPAVEMPALLQRLVARDVAPRPALEPEFEHRMVREIEIATEGEAFQKGVMNFGPLTPFTCPECHGVLVRICDGKLSRFRCHTGHAFSKSALLEGVMDSAEELMVQTMRSLEEAVMLLNEIAANLESSGDIDRARTFYAKAKELEARSKSFQGEVLEHETFSSDNL
jgi:two-component system chemotaxis response regulator CheB